MKKIYLNQKKPSQIIMNGNLMFVCVDHSLRADVLSPWKSEKGLGVRMDARRLCWNSKTPFYRMRLLHHVIIIVAGLVQDQNEVTTLKENYTPETTCF